MRRPAPSAALAALLALAGCARPDATTPVPLPPPSAAAKLAPLSGPTQQLVPGAAIDRRWWRAFGSPTLDALVDQALARNNDLAAADATLRQASEQARAANGARLPQADIGYQAERARVSRTFSNPVQDPDQYLYSLHTSQLTVTYAPDIFGGTRDRIRSARAAAQTAAARLDAARMTVVANLVQAVILQASLRAQLAAGQQAVAGSRSLVDLLERRRQLGDLGEADVSAQRAALATTEAVLPGLERQIAHQRALILTLTGVPAGSALPSLPGEDDLTLPGVLPVSLPAQVIAQRPDVRAAEAQMRGAAADVGVAIAARLPQIQLSGTAGGQAQRFVDMFASGNPFWTLIGGITQPLFHGGQLLHQQRAAEAALDAAKAQYRAAALQAFLDVDDALNGLRTDAGALDAASRADDAARRTLTFTRRQIELGAAGTLQLLNASVVAAQASSLRIQARAARLTDSVLLYQAVGAVPAVTIATAGPPATRP